MKKKKNKTITKKNKNKNKNKKRKLVCSTACPSFVTHHPKGITGHKQYTPPSSVRKYIVNICQPEVVLSDDDEPLPKANRT